MSVWVVGHPSYNINIYIHSHVKKIPYEACFIFTLHHFSIKKYFFPPHDCVFKNLKKSSSIFSSALYFFKFVFPQITLIHVSAGLSIKPTRRFFGQCSCHPPAHHRGPTRKRAQRMCKRKSPAFTIISVYLRKALNCFLVIPISRYIFFPKWIILSYFTLSRADLIILFTFDNILNSLFDPPNFVNVIKFRFKTFNLIKKTKSYNFHLCLFDADETQVLISKHILKTLCTDVTNILFNFLAGDLMMSAENPSTLSSEVRQPPH